MAPVACIHAESTLSASLCRLAQGQVRVPFSAAATVQPVALDGGQPSKGPLCHHCEWSAIYRQQVPSEEGFGCCSGVLGYLWRPSSTCLVVCFSTSSVTSVSRLRLPGRRRQRGDSCGGFKARQQLQPLHGSASVGGSRLKLVT